MLGYKGLTLGVLLLFLQFPLNGMLVHCSVKPSPLHFICYPKSFVILIYIHGQQEEMW